MSVPVPELGVQHYFFEIVVTSAVALTTRSRATGALKLLGEKP